MKFTEDVFEKNMKKSIKFFFVKSQKFPKKNDFQKNLKFYIFVIIKSHVGNYYNINSLDY